MNEPRLLLTPQEACAALGIGRAYLYQLLRAGTIPSLRLGKLRRIALSDLHTYIELKKQEGAIK